MKFINDARIEAAKRFNPKYLCGYLTKGEGGAAIVDRAKILQTKDDERLFIVTMNADYRWDYSDYDNSTIYFQVEDGCIIGGIYNLLSHQKITRRQIVISSSVGVTRQYKYSAPVFDEICRAINNV